MAFNWRWRQNPDGSTGRTYPSKNYYINEDGARVDIPAHPKKIEAGAKINKIEVISVPKTHSKFYDSVFVSPHAGPVIRPGRFEHVAPGTMVKCKCLACGQACDIRYERLRPNSPERSAWSCGCEKRPVGTGRKAKATAERKARGEERVGTGRRRGRPVRDLTDVKFGELEPYSWLDKQGWLCKCHGCGGSCVVRRSYQLLLGTITACRGCRPGDWNGNKGRRRKISGMGASG